MKKSELRIDILDRSLNFSVRIIKMADSLPKTPAGYAISSQVIRSGTSIGANLREAQSASSRRDFTNCVNISLKEARETEYWLLIIIKSLLMPERKLTSLLEENDEFIRILVSIVRKLKINSEFIIPNS